MHGKLIHFPYKGCTMAFSRELKNYLQQLDISAADLAQESGISPSTLSRYLSGERSPASSSEAVLQLARALEKLSNRVVSEQDVARTLHKEITGSEVDARTFTTHFCTLMDTLDINGNRLAHALGFDPSYISRIRTGQRHPANVAHFCDQVARYIARSCTDAYHIESIVMLTGASAQDIANPEICENRIRDYLGSNIATDPQIPATIEPLSKFLATLDAFDLNAFKDEIHFEEIKVPTLPFQLPTQKTYSGIEEMKQAELDFYRAAILSKSIDDIIFYSDMPLEEMAQDKEFPKQVMKAVALLIRKGIKIINIHDVHRPIDELFMGLEGWVPVYMTGLMESYYMPAPTNAAFFHFLRSAGTVACAGEAVVGDQGSGRYVLTKNAADVAYFRTRAMQLLAHAKPLIKVYTEGHEKERDKALRKLRSAYGDNTVTVGEGDFNTLSINALPGRYVLISKSNPPAVDFLVEHPALVAAFEQYEPTLF